MVCLLHVGGFNVQCSQATRAVPRRPALTNLARLGFERVYDTHVADVEEMGRLDSNFDAGCSW